MQFLDLDVDETMAYSEKRFSDLEKEVNRISQTTARLEGVNTGIDLQAKATDNYPIKTLLGLAASAFLLFQGWIGVQTYQQGTKIAAIEQLLIPENLHRISLNPEDKRNIREASKLLRTAEQTNQSISPQIIHDSGTRFIAASAREPEAWRAALNFLSYRSRLNIEISPPINSAVPDDNCKLEGKVNVVIPPGETKEELEKSQSVSAIGFTDESNAARFEDIDSPTSGCGAKFLVYQMSKPGNELLVDGLFLKNVIIYKTMVAYHGGNLKFENVYFVDCTFDFQSLPQSRELANTILANAAVTFSKSS
jgi:hypothetical protein